MIFTRQVLRLSQLASKIHLTINSTTDKTMSLLDNGGFCRLQCCSAAQRAAPV
jgi:hypothetical protein